MNYEKIGEFIASKRKEKDLTQNELAKKVGVTDKAVSKWERGLGCPDISILEILAKELNISVLELLKGRKIENEVINVTEADDYIVDSIKTTKKTFVIELTKKAELILFVLTIIIFFFMIFINVQRHYRIIKKNSYIIDKSSDEMISYYNNLDIIENDIDIIKNNKGLLSDAEQKTVINFLTYYLNYYRNHFLFTNGENMEISYNDLYKQLFIIEVEDSRKHNPEIIPFIHIVRNYSLNLDNYANYSESYKNISKSNSMFEFMYQIKFNQILFNNYESDFDLYLDIYDILLTQQDNYIRQVESIAKLTDDVMKGAKIYE